MAVPTLLEKIEADAANRLTLEPGVLPAQELARFRDFLKVESQRLKLLHRSREHSGREICQARAALTDILARALWNASKSSLSTQAQREFPPLAFIALGGYGRAELNPHSDIDIMFLHDGQVVAGNKPLPSLSKLLDGILYPLYDLNFKVGHCVRTIAECVQVANKDMQSKTSLIEARLVIGDSKLFEKFQKAVLAKCVEGHEDEYIAARLRDQAARRQKFGNSATMQEPNIKSGCGGLRDYQNLHWMAYFKYRTRTLADLEQREMITAHERKQLEAAYDFLLTTRTELHYQVTRVVDVLSKSVQPAVAFQLSYTERSPSKRLERFMGDFYSHSRNIYLITRTLEERLALLPQPKLLPSWRQFIRVPFRTVPVEQLVDGFKIKDGVIHTSSPRVLRDQPRRFMRVFLYAQQRGLRLHPDLVQAMRNDLHLVDRSFLRDEHVRATFLEVLNQRGNVAPALRAMHEVGLLGKYLPEFGRLTCLVQHEFYHQYTADEHTLMCLEQLDQIWEAQAEPLKKYATLLQSLERPFLLYLALLLHDAGKALHDGNHTAGSTEMALQVAKRLDLDGATTHNLRLLIENHLVMAQISQRRDLSDPAVIRNFAGLIQSVENLRMLTLHTVADSQATSNKLWNDFKDSLLWELYARTAQLLEGGALLRAEQKQKELLAAEVKRNLPRPITEEEVEAHFETMPARYFQIHSTREILQDLNLTHRFMYHQLIEDDKALEPVVAWQNEPDRGYSSVKICTWDRAGLFSKIAGAFAATGINILSAQVFTRTDGIVLDTFFVTDAATGRLVNREDREKFEGLLFRALLGGEVDFLALIARQKGARPLYQSLEGERMPTRIDFDKDTSETSTILDIETEDRLGLLYLISNVLSELHLNIFLAKISTEKGAAIDSFYIGESDGQKIVSEERLKDIAQELKEALDGQGDKVTR